MNTQDRIKKLARYYELGVSWAYSEGALNEAEYKEAGRLWKQLPSLIETERKEAEQVGFSKAWGVVKKLMSFSDPRDAEKYLSQQSTEGGE